MQSKYLDRGTICLIWQHSHINQGAHVGMTKCLYILSLHFRGPKVIGQLDSQWFLISHVYSITSCVQVTGEFSVNSLDSQLLIGFGVCYLCLSTWGTELANERQGSHYLAKKKNREIGQKIAEQSLYFCGTQHTPMRRLIEFEQRRCFCTLQNAFCYSSSQLQYLWRQVSQHLWPAYMHLQTIHRWGGGGFGSGAIPLSLHTLLLQSPWFVSPVHKVHTFSRTLQAFLGTI